VAANGPIFIGGPDRSGKTLLAAILGSHSEIAISAVGSNMWTFFYGQFGDLADDRNLDRCLAAMLGYRHVRFTEPDGERIRRDFVAGERSYARLFALFQEQHAERLGKPRWGDQTGLVERYADQIMAAYPGVRMIHMIRDPRDRYEASLALWPKGRGRVGAACARWRYSVDLADRNRRRFGDRYLVVRYEDLVTRPEDTAREVSSFVGTEFEPQMLELRGMPSYRAKLEASVRNAGGDPEAAGVLISPAFIGGYRGRIQPRELAFMQGRLGKRMVAHGYRLDPIPMAVRERLHYLLLDLPLNLARMYGWQGLETIQHHAPRWLGRTPVRAKLVAREG
jgi:sulfotransferase family protein